MFLSGVALSALFAVGIQAGFCGFGLFWRCFNETDLSGFQLI